MDLPYRFHKNTLIIEMVPHDGGLLNGDIDEFIAWVKGLVRPESKTIALDMCKMTYLNSTGLGELIKFKDILTDMTVGLTLIKPGDRVVSLINMVGIDQFFTVVSSEDDLS